jgi:hypothetical protein
MSPAAARDLAQCIETLEAAYEFTLAYAAQGASGAGTGGPGAEVRIQLERANQAIEALTRLSRTAIASLGPQDPGPLHAFVEVVKRDAESARTGIALVLAQPTISSQLVDNLNASIHLRTLLTDLFLLGETLKPQVSPA